MRGEMWEEVPEVETEGRMADLRDLRRSGPREDCEIEKKRETVRKERKRRKRRREKRRGTHLLTPHLPSRRLLPSALERVEVAEVPSFGGVVESGKLSFETGEARSTGSGGVLRRRGKVSLT